MRLACYPSKRDLPDFLRREQREEVAMRHPFETAPVGKRGAVFMPLFVLTQVPTS